MKCDLGGKVLACWDRGVDGGGFGMRSVRMWGMLVEHAGG